MTFFLLHWKNGINQKKNLTSPPFPSTTWICQHLHPHVLPSSQELYVFLLTPCAPEPRCLDLCKKILFLWTCKLSLELIFPSSYHSILLLLLAAKFLKEMSILSPIPLLTVPLKTLHSAFQPYDPI